MRRSLLLLLSLMPLCIVFAQIPRILSYQGVLTDTLGSPKADGTYTFTFRLYESPAGGSPIWTESKTLPVERGLFHTILGDQVIFGPGVAFDRPYWFSIQVASDPELSPRLPLSSTAYSMTSVRSDTARFALNAPQQGFVDSARIAGGIPDNTVTNAKIANGAVTSLKIGAGQVVKELNGITDRITLTAQGGATVTSRSDTIVINAGSGGGGTGVQGVQNTNGTIDVIDPNGPTVTVNVKSNSITATQLANNAVTSVKIADGSIQLADLGQNGAASGQILKWSGTAWEPKSDNIGTGVFLPLSGGTLTGAITSTGAPAISMGKASFGSGNTNAGTSAFVAGQDNAASGQFAAVSGGSNNSATGDNSTVGGGGGNQASNEGATVNGGLSNEASGKRATVGGGWKNHATGWDATVGGGEHNVAGGSSATVGGGRHNYARGEGAVIGGGGAWKVMADSNSALGFYSTIPGGRANLARGSTSFAAGLRAKAFHDGAFVWGDDEDTEVSSDTTNQFKIRAHNGVNLASEAGSLRVIRRGDVYRDNAIVAWGKVSGGGSVSTHEFGVVSVVRNSSGNYTLTLDAGAASAFTLIPVATAETDNPPNSAATARIVTINQVTATTFDVYITNGNWGPTDNDFTFLVTGR